VSWCLFAVLQMEDGEDGAGEVVWGSSCPSLCSSFFYLKLEPDLPCPVVVLAARNHPVLQ
jgi:hypothetical protein